MLTVMTGGSQGLGRVAAEMLPAIGSGARIMGVRRAGSAPPAWTEQPLDLASLDSVRAFVAALPDRPVERLILNAGGQRPDIAARSDDGFETVFASNHLGHYLLLRLLERRLAPGARVVITSSGTHDPAEKTGVPAPRHADADLLAHPDRDPARDRVAVVAGMRAYAASKLCNLMTARALAATDDAQTQGWRVFAYDPGLTPRTGLVRAQPWAVRALLWPLLPLVRPFAKSMNSLADAGRGLFELASTADAPPGRVYASLRKGQLTWPEPSELARNDDVTARLWARSAELVGLGST